MGENRTFLAIEWMDAHKAYAKFYKEFVTVFRLNGVQCVALRGLCDRLEYCMKIETEAKAIGITVEEALEIREREAVTV